LILIQILKALSLNPNNFTPELEKSKPEFLPKSARHSHVIKMNLTGYQKYSVEILSPSHRDLSATCYTLLLHLLVLTRMNRWVCKDSFREFLIRLFLILDQPMKETFEKFMNQGILISGRMGENSFMLDLDDLLSFTGFSRGSLKFHIWGTLEEFIRDYRLITYEVWFDESEDNDLMDSSEDFLIMTIAMNYDLYEIQNLNLSLKSDLSEISDLEISEVIHFVDFLMTKIPVQVFSEYQVFQERRLKGLSYAFTDSDTLFFNPEEELYPARILKIFRIFFSTNDSDLKLLCEDKINIAMIFELLSQYSPYFKFGYGVKYGLIQLSEDPALFHHCFDKRFENGGLSKLLKTKPLITTSSIFKDANMFYWLHLIP